MPQENPQCQAAGAFHESRLQPGAQCPGLIGVGGVFLVEEQPHRQSQQLGWVSSRPPQGESEAYLADLMGLETW